MFTLLSSSDAASSSIWTIDPNVDKLDGVEHPLPRASFIINAKLGASCIASASSLAEIESVPSRTIQRKDSHDVHCFWISVGKKGAKCFSNLNGHRVGKVDWGKGKSVEDAKVIFRNGKSRSSGAATLNAFSPRITSSIP